MEIDDNVLSAPPLLEKFELAGLHGEKTISFSTEHAVSILMARNGSGKTTLLSAINSILTRRMYKLSDIMFDRLTVKLQLQLEFTISKAEVEQFWLAVSESSIAKIASDCNVTTEYVLEVANSIMRGEADLRLSSQDGLAYLYRQHPTLGHRSLLDTLRNFSETMYDGFPELSAADRVISAAMKSYDVVYLPTYRRIETSLSKYRSNRSVYPWRNAERDESSMLPRELNFGLSDITEKLQQISSEIQKISNDKYQEISANIINDLLDGSYEQSSSDSERPDRDELELFFNRIRTSRARRANRFNIPDIDKIYNDDYDESARPFLLYFLANLNDAIKSTKPLEDRVNGFLIACNRYLSDEDYTAYRPGEHGPLNAESKELSIKRDSFRPTLRTKNKEKRISIDALSSGEKQVVSLFARLYLYEKEKIVLFDEPELSLSIGWQAQLLPDLCRSPNFHQLIAITHSPFVFDNELDAYAGNLLISKFGDDEPELALRELVEEDFDDLFDDFDDIGDGSSE